MTYFFAVLAGVYLVGGAACGLVALRLRTERKQAADPQRIEALSGSVQAFSVMALVCLILAAVVILKL